MPLDLDASLLALDRLMSQLSERLLNTGIFLVIVTAIEYVFHVVEVLVGHLNLLRVTISSRLAMRGLFHCSRRRVGRLTSI